MKRVQTLGLVAACSVLALCAFEWSRGARARDEHGLARASAPEERQERAPEELRPAAGFAKDEPEASGTPAPPPAPQRAPALDPSRRIFGRVLFPIAVPAGERVRVRAELHGPPGATSMPELTTLVADDGSFALDPGEGVERARLGVQSRFFRLYELVEVRPGDASVELRPDAFAVVEGLIVPPTSVATGGATEFALASVLRFDARAVELAKAGDPALAAKIEAVQNVVVPDPRGRFTVALLPHGLPFELSGGNPYGPEWTRRFGPLDPGELLEVRVELELGFTIYGRVVDEDGRAVANVFVSAREGPAFSEGADTDSEGRFELARVPRSVRSVRASDRRLARFAEVPVDLSQGDVRDLVLTVVRGKRIEGTVAWPDGTSVDGGRAWARGANDSAKADLVAGGFRLDGLEEGSYDIEVSVNRAGGLGSARAMNVVAGGPPLELVLNEEAALDVAGVVVDPDGDPIADSRVLARGPPPANRVESTSAGKDGRFVLHLPPGEWQVEVSARGYRPSQEWVAVAAGAPGVRVVLQQGGRIRGTVVDTARRPVAGAQVGVVKAYTFFRARDGVTDQDGRFQIEVDSESPRVAAMAKGHAPSEVVALENKPGGVDGVVLQVREECRIVGRVLDDESRPLAGAPVHAPDFSFASGWPETDGEGRFELAGLPPGLVRLRALDPRSTASSAFAEGEVRLAPGQVCLVELRFERPDPVRIRARFSRGGRPIACSLALRTRGFGAEATSDADGLVDAELPKPGQWSGLVWVAAGELDWRDFASTDVRRFELLVPDAEEHSFALDLDGLVRLSSRNEFEAWMLY